MILSTGTLSRSLGVSGLIHNAQWLSPDDDCSRHVEIIIENFLCNMLSAILPRRPQNRTSADFRHRTDLSKCYRLKEELVASGILVITNSVSIAR